MPEERYTSRHTGQQIDDAVDAVANKADINNIGGAKILAHSQAPFVALMSVEKVADTNAENNKMWWSTDGGKLKYKQNGIIYILADSPPYLLYYCGSKIYKWSGSGFIEMTSGGGGGGSSDYPPASGIPLADLAQAVQTMLAAGASAYQKPSGGIPATDLAGDIPQAKLASAVQTLLGKANTAYQKPSGGIPSTDLAGGITNAQLAGSISYTKLAGSIPKSKLASAVQTSLGLADSALQPSDISVSYDANTKTLTLNLGGGSSSK